MESSPVLLPTISQKVTHIYSTSATPQQEGFTTVSTLQQGMLATSLKPMTSRMSSISVSPTYSFDHLDSMASYTPSTHSIASEASFRQKASENSANINLLLNKGNSNSMVWFPLKSVVGQSEWKPSSYPFFKSVVTFTYFTEISIIVQL